MGHPTQPRRAGAEAMIRRFDLPPDRLSSLDRSRTNIIMAPPSMRPKMGQPTSESIRVILFDKHGTMRQQGTKENAETQKR